MTGVPTRLRWALEVLDPRPDERLLELGCGPGVLAALICERLTTGQLLAIDRSGTAVARAARRTEPYLASGVLELRHCELRNLEVASTSFHQAVAVDVNLFWTTPASAEAAVLLDAVRPGGRLHLLYGAGPSDRQRVTRSVAAVLVSAGFEDVEVLDAAAGFGVSASRQ